MKRLKSRRLWVVLAVLVALVLVGRWLDRSQPIQSYRVIDDRTIAVESSKLDVVASGTDPHHRRHRDL